MGTGDQGSNVERATCARECAGQEAKRGSPREAPDAGAVARDGVAVTALQIRVAPGLALSTEGGEPRSIVTTWPDLDAALSACAAFFGTPLRAVSGLAVMGSGGWRRATVARG
jgi:hypothetical protein